MKKTLFILISVFLLSQAHALAFYIDSIYVSPSNPTNTDNITLILSGNFSDTGEVIHSYEYYVNGTNITINIDCSSNGGYFWLVPHDEEINIGSLPEGDYHISVYGLHVVVNLDDISQSDFHVNNASSIKYDQSNDSFSIYPCPTNRNSKVIISSDNKIQSLSVLNSESKMIFRQNEVNSKIFEFNIPDWQSGIYFIRLICDDELFTRKLIIQ